MVLQHHPECALDRPHEATLGIWDCHPDCPIRQALPPLRFDQLEPIGETTTSHPDQEAW